MLEWRTLFNPEVVVHDKVNRIFLSQRFPIRDVRVSGLSKLEEIWLTILYWKTERLSVFFLLVVKQQYVPDSCRTAKNRLDLGEAPFIRYGWWGAKLARFITYQYRPSGWGSR